ncbi:MAG: outer membrane lipoprotein chaperone LolA [Pseudohongiellaceae bacterium]
MSKLSNLQAALSILALCVAGSLPAQQPMPSAALDRLDALLGSINTLSADVTQLIVESDGGVLEQSEIQMQLKKPDGFYWETLSPFPELIVTNGSLLWNYQPDLEQVVIEEWNSSRSELAAQLLSGNIESLSADYTVESVTAAGSGHQEFELTPIETGDVYERISINFMSDELESIYLKSKNGQQTVWRFAKVIRNQAIADTQFEFIPPANIEIIENDYGR